MSWGKNLLAAGLITLSGSFSPALAQGDPVYDFATDNPGMSAAIASARASLDIFLANTLDNGVSGPQTMLKVSIPTASSDEVIWITPFAQTAGDEWIGVLANQPQFIEGANAGDTVTFTTAQIADWAVFDSTGLMFGGYTIREMVVSGAIPAESTPPMSDDPIPTEW